MSRLLISQPYADQDGGHLLSDALRALPTAEPGPDFDERVLSALHEPRPWWITLWGAMRPVLASAACSLCVTLVLIAWSTKAPVGLEPMTLGAVHPEASMASAPLALGDLDRLHGRAPTRANLMAALLIPDAAAPVPVPLPPRKAPELPHIRRQSCAPVLLA